MTCEYKFGHDYLSDVAISCGMCDSLLRFRSNFRAPRYVSSFRSPNIIYLHVVGRFDMEVCVTKPPKEKSEILTVYSLDRAGRYQRYCIS